MLPSRTATEDSITNENMLYAGYLLAKNLLDIENDIIRHHKKPKKIDRHSIATYVKELNIIADKLREISVYYYQSIITTDDQLLHHHIKEQSPGFLQLTNASDNLTSLIITDILNQQSYDHMLLAAERWAYILKLCYERNDFQSCSTIAMALNSSSLSKVLIPDLLSESARAIITHIGSISLRPKILHTHHEIEFYACEQVVPSMAALTHLLQAVEVQPDGHDSKAYIEQEKTRYSLFYQRIQSSLECDLRMIDNKLIVTLNKQHTSDSHVAILQRIQQIAVNRKNPINLTAFTKSIGLYKSYDAFYIHSHELTGDIDGYHLANATSKDPLVPQILQIMRDGRLSPSAKLKALIELEQIESDKIDAQQQGYINAFKGKLGKIIITVAHLPNPVPKIGTSAPKDQDDSEEETSGHVVRYASHHAVLFRDNRSSDSSDDSMALTPQKSLSANIPRAKK